MGALFGFVALGTVLCLFAWIGDKAQNLWASIRESGVVPMMVLGVVDFFTTMFSNTKKLVYYIQEEWREFKWHLQKRSR